MRPGDRIIAVGETTTVFATHTEVVALVGTQLGQTVHMLLLAPCGKPAFARTPPYVPGPGALPIDELGFEIEPPQAPPSHASSCQDLQGLDDPAAAAEETSLPPSSPPPPPPPPPSVFKIAPGQRCVAWVS